MVVQGQYTALHTVHFTLPLALMSTNVCSSFMITGSALAFTINKRRKIIYNGHKGSTDGKRNT